MQADKGWPVAEIIHEPLILPPRPKVRRTPLGDVCLRCKVVHFNQASAQACGSIATDRL